MLERIFFIVKRESHIRADCMKRFATLLVVFGLLNGCASHEAMNASELEPGRLPAPDITLSIAGLGRVVNSNVELKVGVLTALLGAPFFIYLAFKSKSKII